MNKDFADRWVADLRHPSNKQRTGVLHDGVGYCCLGRALVVGGFKLVPKLVPDWNDPDGATKLFPGVFVIDGTQFDDGTCGEDQRLDKTAMDTLGFAGSGGEAKDGTFAIGGRIFGSLADANDNGITFAQIADWVEKNWERL